ncbi:MAG: hypothetical protein J6P54_09170, partial [Bacteroidales bacterium]|nr:hypothetical protein [Bacteroidales bacterium]
YSARIQQKLLNARETSHSRISPLGLKGSVEMRNPMRFFRTPSGVRAKYLGYHKNTPYKKIPTRINIAEYQHIHATLTAYFLNFGDNSSTSCACNNLLNLTITAFMGANLDMRTPCSSKMKIILYLK